MKQLITIFKSLGTIVILLFQIAYVAIIDYMSTFDNPKPKQTDTKNKTATSNNVSSNNKDVCWNSKEWKDEVVHERPHYKN